MSQELSTTSYALLGLFVFEGPESAGMTGYELKQRADKTLRFYWVSPAMSQVYTELDRLVGQQMVMASDELSGKRRTRRYRITALGFESLQGWLNSSATDFPTLKHPVALKLLMGALMQPDRLRSMLKQYVDDLAVSRADLLAVRTGLGDLEAFRYPALVAEWGLDYYDAETEIVTALLEKLAGLPERPG
ncbi:DNA-binding PadR family transcriptional regulator [Microlunatus panaciterrae]|uniref:DNA-binding PadR family transcriptional regulator n=1 Tax=Microlunatus panaciterrae TaxID=400768 RepID=A0ABS2RJ71_9ACTN|nr:DNA-binding PadR family transcriptional regulator [Microlunatus panaciterrae]